MDHFRIGNTLIDYYVKNGDNAYFHYRWDKDTNVFRMVGSDSYSKSEVDAKVKTLENTIAQQVEERNIPHTSALR